MKRKVSRLCLMLLMASLCGCVGNPNVVYFPHLFSSPYEDFDPHSVRLEIRPLDDATNPVRTQHVIIATVYDKDNTPRRGRRVEWMIEGVGSIIEVDKLGNHEHQRERQRAVTSTAMFEHRVSRGNNNPADDFMVRPGQTWCIVSSPVEGDTHVTVYAPGIADWSKSKVYRTIRWVDANWEFPPSAQARSGTQHVFTTHVFRHTDKQPLAKYRVRYKIDGGAPAVFIPSQTQEYDSVSDLNGNAQVAIMQTTPGVGQTHVAVEIIRPPDPSAPSGAGVVLARGDTAVEWLAPAVSLLHTGPPMAVLGSEVSYETAINNVGKVESRSMMVTSDVPEGLQYVRSNPPAFVADGKSLTWALPVLPPGQTHRIQTTYKTLRQGTVNSCAAVTTEEGLKDQKCAMTNVTTAGLKVAITGPPTSVVGAPITFNVTATNPGNGPLENVILTATFSDGLEHEKNAHALNTNLGTLAPQETRPMALVLMARKPGVQTVSVTATANNLSDQAVASVTVQQPQVSLTFEKAPKTKFVDRPGEWTLVLTNPGDAVLTNVVVRDRLPPELDFVKADQPGRLENGEVVWMLGSVQPKETRRLTVTMVGKSAVRSAVQTAVVSADAGIKADAQAAVEILNTPAGLGMEVESSGNPVQIGKRIVYTIKVVNSGLTPGQQVELKVVVPTQLKIISADGPGQKTINGQMIIFGKVDGVTKERPSQYRIEAEGLLPADARLRIELLSQGMNPANPIVREEQTRVWDPGQGVPAPPVAPPPPPPAP